MLCRQVLLNRIDEARLSKCLGGSGEGGMIHLFQVRFWDDAIKPDIAVQLMISEISVKRNGGHR